MKTTKMSIALLAAMLVLSSCQKEEELLKESGTQVAGVAKEAPVFNKMKTWKVVRDDNGKLVSWGCYGLPTNCLSPVVVTPKSLVVFEQVFDALDNGNYGSAIHTMMQNGQEVKDVMGSNLYDSVMNGDLKLSYMGQSPDGSGEDLYLLFTDNLGNTEAVIPLDK